MQHSARDNHQAVLSSAETDTLIEALFSEVNPMPVKCGLDFMGYQTGIPRLPLTQLKAEHKEELKKAMQSYGII